MIMTLEALISKISKACEKGENENKGDISLSNDLCCREIRVVGLRPINPKPNVGCKLLGCVGSQLTEVLIKQDMGQKWKWKSRCNSDYSNPIPCITSEGNEQSRAQRPEAKNVRALKKSRVLTIRDEKVISIPSTIPGGQPLRNNEDTKLEFLWAWEPTRNSCSLRFN